MFQEWPFAPPENVAEANMQAVAFQRLCGGAKMMLLPAQWDAFKRAGLDMANFARVPPIPRVR